MAIAVIDRREGNCFALSGQLGPDSANGIRAEGEAIIASIEGTVCFDLSGVVRCNSAGISLLLCWMRVANQQGKTIIFQQMPLRMLDMARVSGLDEVLPIENG